MQLERIRQQEIERLTNAAKTLASRDSKAWHGSKWVPELENQDGTSFFASREDMACIQEAIMLHARGRAVLAKAEREAKRDAHLQREVKTIIPESLSATSLSPSAKAVGAGAPSASGLPLAGPSLAAAGPGPSKHDDGTDGDHDGGSTSSTDALRGSRSLALSLFLSAVEALSRVSDPSLLNSVDNPAHLYLDIVWLYFRMGDLSHLDSATDYLQRATAGFKRAHGENLSRLISISGEGCAERMLYVRLHLLEGVVAYLQGDTGRASTLLQRAKAECAALRVRPAELQALRSFGFTTREAESALRATSPRAQQVADGLSDDAAFELRVSHAVSAASDARDKLAMKRAMDREKRVAAARQRRFGKTNGGKLINIVLLDAMVTNCGFEEQIVAEALRQCDNDQEGALQALTGAPEVLLAALQARHEEAEARRAAKQQRQAAAPASAAAAGAGASAGAAAAEAAATPTDAVAGPEIIDAPRVTGAALAGISTGEAQAEQLNETDSDDSGDDQDVDEMADVLRSGGVMDNEAWYGGLSTGDDGGVHPDRDAAWSRHGPVLLHGGDDGAGQVAGGIGAEATGSHAGAAGAGAQHDGADISTRRASHVQANDGGALAAEGAAIDQYLSKLISSMCVSPARFANALTFE